MTVASSASGRFVAVDVDTMSENRRKARFLKNKFLLAGFHGRHRRSPMEIHAKCGWPAPE